MSKLRPHSRPSLVMAAAGAAMVGALGIAGTASAADWPMFRATRPLRCLPGDRAQHDDRPLAEYQVDRPARHPQLHLACRGHNPRPALVYAAAGNHFYAYPARGGAAAWRFTLPAGVAENSPAVAGGVVYFGSTAGPSDALNASTGARICSFSTGQAILASPVVVNSGSRPVVYDGIPERGYRERNTLSTVPATLTAPARKTGNSVRGRCPRTVLGPLRPTGWARTAFRCSCSAARTATIPCTR